MALNFTGTNLVNCGSSASLDNFTVGTWLVWGNYPTADVTARIVNKGTTVATTRGLRHSTTGTGSLNFSLGRATTHLEVEALFSNFAAAGTNKDVFYAVVFDAAGVNGDQKLYMGDRATPAAEPSAYAIQTVGSGATGDDSAADFTIGNGSGGSNPYGGNLSIILVTTTKLVLGAIRSFQFNPEYVLGAKGFWVLGQSGGSSEPDYSGNGNTGTITGATVARHGSVGPWWGMGVPSVSARAITPVAPDTSYYYRLMQQFYS